MTDTTGAGPWDGPALGPNPLDAAAVAALEELSRLIARGVAGCSMATISLFDATGPVTVAVSHPSAMALDQEQYSRRSGPCMLAMERAEVVAVDDFGADVRWPELADAVAAAQVNASLSLPLFSPGGGAAGDDGAAAPDVVGGVNLYARRPDAFSDESRAAAVAYSRHAEWALGLLGRLGTEQSSRRHEREVVASVQRSLLPTLPVIGGITTAARYLVGSARAEIGGDWYDVFPLPDGAVGVAIGDVCGHDLAAAAAMGQLRSVVRSYAYAGSSPSSVLDRMDRLVQDFAITSLATAVYGRLILDSGRGLFVFTNAGHPPPLVRRRDGSVTTVLGGATALIGATDPDRAPRTAAALVLEVGDLLLLYTDGLVETRHDDIGARIDLLAAALAGLPVDASPEQVCDGVLAAMAHADREDDIALVALRIDGPAAA